MKHLPWFFLLLLLGCDSRETKVQRFLLQGNEAVQKQNSHDAKRYFSEALKLDPCFADAWNNLGTIYFKEGNLSEALSHYDKAIECHPDFYSAYLNRANTFYELNQPAAALRDLATYSRNRPDTSVVFFARGLNLTKLRKFNEAKTAFTKAYSMDPTNGELLINIGTVYYYQQQYDSADVVLKEAQQSRRDDPNILNLLSLIQLEKGNVENSMSLINQALRIQPSNAYFLNNRGYLYLLRDSLERAREDIDQSIGEDPYNGWAYRNKGLYFLKLKNFNESIRLLSKAFQMDSTINSIETDLAEAYYLAGRKKEACNLIQKVIKMEHRTNQRWNVYCK